jgi:hypothetical protein
MNVIRQDIYNVKKSDIFRIYPLGDIHLLAKACEENKFKAKVKRIAEDPNGLWLGMGDFGDFINPSDPRFDFASLADFLTLKDLADLPKVTKDRFLDIVKPIAHKCIALIEGNHERAIYKHYERNIYSEIVTGIKELGNFPADKQLALGVYGWIILAFHQSKPGEQKEGSRVLKINAHHGFTGGRYAGSKSNTMQRWLQSVDANLVLMGHSHNTEIMVETVETVNAVGEVVNKNKIGCFTGTFLQSRIKDVSTYSELKGFMPQPLSNVIVTVKPFGDTFIKAEIEYL